MEREYADNTSLMPQRWFMDAVEMIFVNDNKVISMLSCDTASYIFAILSIGVGYYLTGRK